MCVCTMNACAGREIIRHSALCCVPKPMRILPVILHDSDQLFAAKYAPYLPSEDELRAEIEAQKHFFALQQQEAKSEEGLA